MGLFKSLFGTYSTKELKRIEPIKNAVLALEDKYAKMSEQELKSQTGILKDRLAAGETLDDILPDAFAVCREASTRVIGIRHYPVQIIGGIVLHQGRIAEMKTGEGKTFVAALPSYLNGLTGKGVHIVTVNDYLAKRDSELMAKVHRYLGLTVGLIAHDMDNDARRAAYACDITYATNNELGFDYLRDNMCMYKKDKVQREPNFAIVDEVDSILIDEARTPLIISGAGTQAAETYNKFARVMVGLVPEADFDMDEAKKTINATESGLEKIEAMLGIDDIYADPSGQLPNHLQQALKAQFLFHRDVDYVVVNGEVKIVDEFTGRIMEGRRYSEGLHQALEAKERVLVREENQTLATITLQNYFRLYEKLSGMTGTAMTEDAEFREIYKLPVVAIPPNRPVARKDEDDLIYRTVEAKFNAVADDVAERNKAGQPCLIGTVSIESSEKLSRLLDKRGIKHETLNAKNHEREAHIIAQAGRVGAVTIATNMAGRGTDILLGGNPDVLADDVLRERGLDPDAEPLTEDGEPNPALPTDEQRADALAEAKRVCAEEHDQVIAAGGLTVIGTERHESRRIDNQLRGRAGRQGDPGVTQFYLSLEDDLMRLFGGNRMDSIARMMEKTDMPEDMPIQAGMVSKAIEGAQRQVESMHFAARKNVLEYDDVMNLQRVAIYSERNAILDGKDMDERIPEIIGDAVEAVVAENCPAKVPSDDWDAKAVELWAANMTGRDDFSVAEVDHDDDPAVLSEALEAYLEDVFASKSEQLGEPVMKMLEGQVMLRMIDTRWMAHLQEMDYLKAGIGLRAFGQRDPLVEYKNEAYNAFQNLTAGMYEDYLRTLLRLQVAVKQEQPALAEDKSPLDGKVSYSSPEQALEQTGVGAARKQAAASPSGAPAAPPKPAAAKPQTYTKDKDDPFANVGRNEPCPCGSGLKYKKCHGRDQ